MKISPFSFFLITTLWLGMTAALPAAFEHAEARHTHPVALTPDGSRLLAVDSVNARLSVFDVTGAGAPVRVVDIPTGLEPVSVRALTNDEVWVVNELSDSISVISLSQKAVLATLSTADEPADVVFAQGKAFVSCARSNSLIIFDTADRSLITAVPLALEGLYPRALTTSADGSKVYVAFFESGNGTTILPKDSAPAQPAPSNGSLPAPPKTALIVPANDSRVSHTTLDHDVVGIDAVTHSIIGYASGVGTTLFDLAPHPVSGDLWVGNTDALNLIRFEPNLRGRFAKNQVTRIAAGTGAVTVFDLNPGVDYDVLPNPAAQATALAQPASLVFSGDGNVLWVAAFGTDRIARLNPADGSVQSRVDLRMGVDVSAAAMRGPRGLALDEAGQRLFVLNKLSHTLSVVSTNTLAVTHEIAISEVDPTPASVKAGRGYLFDARLSGNGTVSCGTCHFDADRDGLAWDLGDPGGEMMTVLGANLSIHDTTPRPRVMHPMKGPMATQTLRGMQDGAPFHWRGDRATLADFNPTFDMLMGGEQIDEADMADLSAYMLSIVNHPNPNRKQDRSLPSDLGNGNPTKGRDLYNDHNKSHCAVCHVLPKGSDNNIDLPQEVGSTQPLKTPPLRTVYQRQFYNPRPGQESLTGFGMLHDGTGFVLPIVHPYVLDNLNLEELRHVTAFLMCFDTGVAPAVGLSATVTTANRSNSGVLSTLTLLENRAKEADCDLIVRGLAGGQSRNFLYNPVAQTYRREAAASAALSRSALLALLQEGDSLTFLGTLPSAGMRLSVDEDEDGFLNADDPNPGLKDGPPRIVTDLADHAAPPGGSISFQIQAEGLGLTYKWYKGSQLIPTATGAMLTLGTVSSADAGSYSVRVENETGFVNSRTALLEIYPVPQITAHPQSVSLKQGQKATFSVTASGDQLKYQWRRGTSPVGGATERELVLNEVSEADIGSYNVVVSNGAGSVTSQSASLGVILKPVMNPLNLPGAIVGQDYQAQLTATNSPTRFNVSGLPAGLTYDATTGVISGRPKTGKVYTVKASATNAAGAGEAITQEVTVESFPQDLLGVFEGAVPLDEVRNGNLGGRIRITLSKTGGISGKLDYGAAVHAFKGVVEISPEMDPVAEITVKRPKADPLTLHLTFNRVGRSVQTRIGPEEAGQVFTASLPTSNFTAVDGGYTLVLKAGEWPEGSPAGHGHGAFKSLKGKARGVMVLADGSKVTLSGSIGQSGGLIFRTLLYGKTGVAQGSLKIGPGEGRSLTASEVSWFKGTQTKFTRLYAQGFGPFQPMVAGGLYEIPGDNEIALELPSGSGNARLVFEAGELQEPETRVNLYDLELQAGSPAKMVLSPSNPGKVKLTVTPGKGTAFNAASTGLLKGTFELSDPGPNGKPVKRKAAFTGRIVRDGGTLKGQGFFLLNELPEDGSGVPVGKTPQHSGRVILESSVP